MRVFIYDRVSFTIVSAVCLDLISLRYCLLAWTLGGVDALLLIGNFCFGAHDIVFPPLYFGENKSRKNSTLDRSLILNIIDRW